MFLLIDTDLNSFMPFYDHVNELDDKPVLGAADLENFTDYEPEGSFHFVEQLSEVTKLTRWDQLVLASLGARLFTNDESYKYSPLYAGKIPAPDKIRKVSVDGVNSERRTVHMAQFGVNYVGRTKLDPRNIFVLDNKKGNPLHDPSKDPALEALYASLPDDWWGSCGFVSTNNADKLKAFLEDQEDVIPITFTSGGAAKLKHCGREFVTVGEPNGKEEYGIEVRNLAHALSYNLSFT